jgi:ElaB/YqjD/DUF883 family membrane-anchored ribosome-binding protein
LYELHPLCTLFPRITGAEFDALVADIKVNGLREPIIIHDDMILDGGNRYRACIEAGVDPVFKEFAGGNIVSYVLSANLHRRHLSALQSAAIVASAQDWAMAQTVGGNGSNQHKKQSGNITELHPSDENRDQSGNITGLQTVASRRAQSGASDKTQRMADKIARADPELAKALGRGEVSPFDAIEKVTGKRHGAKRQPSKEEIPAGSPQPEEIQELRSRIEELTDTAKELLEENASIGAVFDADDKLAELHAENKKLRELNRVLNERIHGLQGEANEAKRAAKYWRAKFDALSKSLSTE